MFLGRGNAGRCAVTLYVGEGPRGSYGARFTLHRISVTPSTSHNQIGPLWCWFLSGWACAHSTSLWVSPTTSPVRLGVSPAATPTPMGIFFLFFFNFYCYSITVVCLFSPSLPPPRLNPPPSPTPIINKRLKQTKYHQRH